jgi:hypothetical protein
MQFRWQSVDLNLTPLPEFGLAQAVVTDLGQ